MWTTKTKLPTRNYLLSQLTSCAQLKQIQQIQQIPDGVADDKSFYHSIGQHPQRVRSVIFESVTQPAVPTEACQNPGICTGDHQNRNVAELQVSLCRHFQLANTFTAKMQHPLPMSKTISPLPPLAAGFSPDLNVDSLTSNYYRS